MKKAALSTLCSALVIPGLGQVLNQHLKKGLFLLAAVFVLFVAALVKLYHIMNTVFVSARAGRSESLPMVDRIKGEDLTVLWLIIGAFTILWLYSVIDAFITGRKIDRNGLR
ncbi:MAG: hypothetical protein GY849_12685 [Deltaproteobacteria bacterium]|nr:hypothetical protein [Deltaproteobacteria bacterium]